MDKRRVQYYWIDGKLNTEIVSLFEDYNVKSESYEIRFENLIYTVLQKNINHYINIQKCMCNFFST